MSDQDQRHNPRIKICLEVELTVPDGGPLTLKSENLSNSGIFLSGDGQVLPQIGAEVFLRLKQPLGDGEAPLVKARVVRMEGDGIGLAFDEDAS